MSNYSLSGHVALVTGSSKGLGASIVRNLASAGASVAVNAFNNTDRAQKLADEINEEGGKAIAVGADVTKASQIKALVEEVTSRIGPIDIVVPNATGPQPHKPIEEYDEDFYQEMYEFFIKSPFLLAQATLPFMKEKKWGRFVNIISEVFSASVSDFSAYVAAKGGQIGWSRSMARELASFGITVNMVGPGWIPVERHADDPQDKKDAYLAQIPAGRWGVPDDVAHAVRFFCSEEASFITGQTLYVNGGMTPW
ncbi:MAG: 3-oxoacyl-ACP reductase FabG [Roseibacillus sp.]|nr:3-oxoacyl-ACP reductase FabG [Roseibacillus sp.]